MANWERPILFEGFALSGTAIAIDHLALHDNLPEMSEATCDWLWRFTICVGRSRTDTSENILRHVSEAIDLLSRFKTRLLQTVPVHYDESFRPEVLDSWLVALQSMAEIATTRTHCTWAAALRSDDRNYGRSFAEIAGEMLTGLDEMAHREQE